MKNYVTSKSYDGAVWFSHEHDNDEQPSKDKKKNEKKKPYLWDELNFIKWSIFVVFEN